MNSNLNPFFSGTGLENSRSRSSHKQRPNGNSSQGSSMTSLASPTKRSRKNLQPIDESGESFVESQVKFLDKTQSEGNKAGNHQSPTTQKQRRSYNSSIKTY